MLRNLVQEDFFGVLYLYLYIYTHIDIDIDIEIDSIYCTTSVSMRVYKNFGTFKICIHAKDAVKP